jgi:hypothetical protein
MSVKSLAQARQDLPLVWRITVDIGKRNRAGLASKVLKILVVVTNISEIRVVRSRLGVHERRKMGENTDPQRPTKRGWPSTPLATCTWEAQDHLKRKRKERLSTKWPEYRGRLSYLPARVPRQTRNYHAETCRPAGASRCSTCDNGQTLVAGHKAEYIRALLVVVPAAVLLGKLNDNVLA